MNNMDEFEYKPNARAVRAARTFIRVLSEEYGATQGMNIWDNIRQCLGEQIASDIFLGMLTQAGRSELLISKVGHDKIAGIKAIRLVSGLGLKEAKDLFEMVESSGPQLIKIPDTVSDDTVQQFLRDMRYCGCAVE